MIKIIIDSLFTYIAFVGALGVAIVITSGVAMLVQDCIQTVIKRGKRKFTNSEETELPYF